QPRFTHAAIVECGGIARISRSVWFPVHTLLNIGDAVLVRRVEPGYPLPVLPRQPQRPDAVHSGAHADVPADHVGYRQRALGQRADLVTLVDVLPPSGFGATGCLAGKPLVDFRDLVGGPRLEFDGVVLFASARLAALSADHVAVLAAQDHAFVVAEHLSRPLVDGAVGEFAALVQRRDQRIAAKDAVVGAQGCPPFAG